jgi:hypothetical protein
MSGSLSRRSLRAVVAVFAATAVAAAPIPLPQTWWGTTVLPEGVDPGITANQFEVQVFRLTTDQEVATLAAAFREGGQPALRDAMFRLKPLGWIRFGKLVATDLVMVRVMDLPDGRRRLRLFSPHPLRLYDKSDAPGTHAHPFGYMELFADASGKGSGALIAAASLSVSDEGLRFDSAGVPVVVVERVETDSPPRP